VDAFWDQHILDTRKYAEDCAAAFGHFLHHYPYSGMGDEVSVEIFSERKQATQTFMQKEFPSLQVEAKDYYQVFSWVNDGNNCDHHS